MVATMLKREITPSQKIREDFMEEITTDEDLKDKMAPGATRTHSHPPPFS